MAGKGKYNEWLSQEKLDQVTNWAANGLMNKEIAANIGVRAQTVSEWSALYPEFAEAIKKGRKLSVQAIENQFFKNAFGSLEETTEIIEEDQVFDGKNWVSTKRHVRKTIRKIPPNTAAQIFYLKNKAGYSDTPEIKDSDLDKVNEIIIKIKDIANE